MGIKTVLQSGNRKTGFMAATYRKVGETCPSSCPLLNAGCYAQQANVGIHEKRSLYDESDGMKLYGFILTLPKFYILRHHVSGDVMKNDAVDWDYIAYMNKGHATRKDIRGFGYTHAWKQIGQNPFTHVTINASCQSVSEVKEAISLGYMASMVGDSEDTRVSWREDGLVFRVCPQQLSNVQCNMCMLCHKRDPKKVIVFRAHGRALSRVNATIRKLKNTP